jgi:hypothetical protein
MTINGHERVGGFKAFKRGEALIRKNGREIKEGE